MRFIGLSLIVMTAYADQFGPDAFVREPYVWFADRSDLSQTSWKTPRYSTGETVVPHRQQKDDPGSLLRFYRDLIIFKNYSRPLTYGDIEPSGMHIEEVVSFKRKHENEELLVLHNVSDVEVTIGVEQGFNEIVYSTVGNNIHLADSGITLPALSTIIMEKK